MYAVMERLLPVFLVDGHSGLEEKCTTFAVTVGLEPKDWKPPSLSLGQDIREVFRFDLTTLLRYSNNLTWPNLQPFARISGTCKPEAGVTGVDLFSGEQRVWHEMTWVTLTISAKQGI